MADIELPDDGELQVEIERTLDGMRGHAERVSEELGLEPTREVIYTLLALAGQAVTEGVRLGIVDLTAKLDTIDIRITNRWQVTGPYDTTDE